MFLKFLRVMTIYQFENNGSEKKSYLFDYF